MKKLFYSLIVLSFFCISSYGQNSRIGIHDPVMIRHDGTYYIFATGRGISVYSSSDMKTWKRENPIFSEAPEWAVKAVPGFRGHIWAPDISYHNGQYYIYYSISRFGKNTSCIGLATNKTLDPDDPEFKWIDHGKVIQSYPGKTNWNAIDPNIIIDENGTPWMSYGSFWDGLQIVELNKEMTSPAEGKEPKTFASRKTDLNIENPPSVDNNPVVAGGNAIEAPFIFKKDDYYYLFASIDYCCKGINSTYKMIVGRSENVTGPYIDKEGKSMRTGGGSILMQGDDNWYGVGHNAVVSFDGIDYLVFHAYDANDEGHSKLRIFRLKWDNDGWPIPGKAVY